ncbi:MAG: hypothetical protein JSV23_02070 [Promethearchaeota archaeon]|nr:MAG: hypothetical protein JSV23_02070 [Candidatus Lokiarchaeota archaeon]
MVLEFMGTNGNGKQRNGWTYNKKALKSSIENNKYVKNVRKKLMEEKLRKKVQK